ncbi:MAG: acyl-CoA synthetase [Mycobacteriales bacterium]
MLLGDAVELGARKFGPRPAIIFGERVTTFAELADRVRRLTGGLLGLAEPGDRVAILMENRPEFVEAYYGVPMAGMILTFLNYRLNPRELASIVRDAGATVLLTEPKYLPAVAAIRDGNPATKVVVCADEGGDAGDKGGDLTYDELLAGGPPTAAAPDVSPDDVAWLIYTSGTTGAPKGAMLTHRNLLTALFSWLIATPPSDPGDAYFMPFPLCHVAGYGVPGYALRGTTLVLRPTYEPGEFLTAVARHGVTGTPMAPTMLNMLLAHPELDNHDLSSLRTIAYGASSMPVEVLRAAMHRFPDAQFVQGFGMTELSGNVLFLDPASHVEAMRRPELLAAAGRPMPLADVRVVDDALSDVPTGEVGEIVVRGDQVMKGYWNNPAATTEAFAGGWFHSGDLARVDEEGYVYVVDRKKDMIVTGGENVYSRQVEDVLYTHPAVAEAAVVGIPDVHWGETVCAVVVLRPDAHVTAEEIVALCRDQLAGYKKPRRVAFVDELPKNASGKVLKRELRTTLTTP